MSARAWKRRRHAQQVQAVLRRVWRTYASIRRVYPVKSDFMRQEQQP